MSSGSGSVRVGHGTPRGQRRAHTVVRCIRSADLRRDETGLTQRDRERAERDLARVDRQHAVGVDDDREPVHAARRRSVGRADGLDVPSRS